MRNALEHYDITDTGPPGDEKLYVIDDNATTEQVDKVMSSIKKRLEDNPDKKHLIIFMMAGHGMIEN